MVRGTKFNLKAYDDSSDVETVLVEGAVDFRAADHVVALHPGQKVSYNPTDNDLTLQTVNVEAELAARLRTFRHVDLAQIAGVIEDFYGIGVAFRSEALKNIQFTGTLDFNMPKPGTVKACRGITENFCSRKGTDLRQPPHLGDHAQNCWQ